MKRIKKFFKRKKTEKTVLFQPQLSHEELAKINEPQAKIIYEDAKSILRDNQESIKSLTSKADSLFKHVFTIQSALCGLFIWLSKNPDSLNKIALPAPSLLLFSFVIFLMPVFIYAANFLTPVGTKGVNNPPENTLKEKATYQMPTFYICEAVAIQRHAIPFNEGVIKKKVFWLRAMVGTSLLATLLTFLIFLG